LHHSQLELAVPSQQSLHCQHLWHHHPLMELGFLPCFSSWKVPQELHHQRERGEQILQNECNLTDQGQ
jgi:hypothetical protein